MKLYIDPGTGSMLFAILIGIIGALNYLVKGWIVKLRFLLSSGKQESVADTEIPLVIFSDDKRYWPIFEPICRELDRRNIDVVYMTASPDDPGIHNPYQHIRGEFIGEGNKAFAKLNFLKATLLLSSTPGLDVYQWKRSKNIKYYVHIPHASSDITLYRMFGIDYFDALLLSGEYQMQQVRDLEKLRNLPPKEICIAGIPYMDEMVKRLKEHGASAGYERTVLLAPSWGPSAIFSKFGGKIIDKLLDTGYHVIIRPHPQSFTSEKDLMDTLMKKYPASDQLEWNCDVDNFEVLNRSSILISDFSGVIFDFALVYDKPVIYADTEFDCGLYDQWWLDSPLWTFEILPRIGQKLTGEKMDNLKEMIDTCLSDPRYAQGRREAREETWEHPDEGAARVADYLQKKYLELTADKGEV